MTDKEQIMIDGVDIGECKHYERHSFYDCNETCEDNGAIVCTNCEDNPDCYFKQLARKTQECEELKTENEELNNRMVEVTYRATGGRLSYSNYTLDAIEQAFNDQLEILSDRKVENETKELKQKLYLAQNEVHFKTEYIQEQRDIIKKLEQECEQKEKEFKELKRQYKLSCLDCEYKNTKADVARYRKALEEIEGLVKNFCKDCDDYENCNWDKEGCYYSLIPNLKDIINKTKGEGNEE